MKILVVAIMFLFGIQSINSAAKKCYSCINCGCDDPFNKNAYGVTQTVPGNGWCSKVKRTENGKVTITRIVSLLPPKKAGCETLTGDGFKTVTCYCDKDLCNGSRSLKSSNIFVFLVLNYILLLVL